LPGVELVLGETRLCIGRFAADPRYRPETQPDDDLIGVVDGALPDITSTGCGACIVGHPAHGVASPDARDQTTTVMPPSMNRTCPLT
jgi:hypothetical protein